MQLYTLDTPYGTPHHVSILTRPEDRVQQALLHGQCPMCSVSILTRPEDRVQRVHAVILSDDERVSIPGPNTGYNEQGVSTPMVAGLGLGKLLPPAK